MKTNKDAIKDAKALANARIIAAIYNYAKANDWHYVNDYPQKRIIQHAVYITPTGSVIAFGVDANNEVLVWNKAF